MLGLRRTSALKRKKHLKKLHLYQGIRSNPTQKEETPRLQGTFPLRLPKELSTMSQIKAVKIHGTILPGAFTRFIRR